MALKEYEYNGSTYQFEEGQEPAGAVEVKQAPQPKNKQRTPKNKR